MRKIPGIKLVVGVSIVVIILILLIKICFASFLNFDPSKLINDSFDFLLKIIALYLSFYLGQAIGEKEKKNEKKRDISNLVETYFSTLKNIIEEVVKQATILSGTRDNQVEKNIYANFAKARLLGDSFFIFFKDVEFLDQEVVNNFLETIYPQIISISSITVIWGNQQEIISSCKAILDRTNQILTIRTSYQLAHN